MKLLVETHDLCLLLLPVTFCNLLVIWSHLARKEGLDRFCQSGSLEFDFVENLISNPSKNPFIFVEVVAQLHANSAFSRTTDL